MSRLGADFQAAKPALFAKNEPFQAKRALSTEKDLKTHFSGPAPPGESAAGRRFGGAELRIRRGGRGIAAALEEAAQVLVDGIRAHHGAFRRLLHVVVEAQVGPR